ncbi:aldose epimerase family protein [Shimia abyssi]|uniref:Aldose 1-epimerase n=1 Tax=Shimia abyssi TaxID=1662395 RepID=A0A2P8F9N7_9RHOB|nr:aldose epimerase family protein [Shimia abyssi]PSL18441.1 aldose 1-epimerase [Shimia abyssi]
MHAFGTMPTGETVHRLRLEGGGLTAHVLTYGAVLQDLRLEGHDAPLVLGFPEFAPYLDRSPFFGAIAGRYANRIADGHLEIDGATHQLACNFLGKHCLHGGLDSMGKRLWQVQEHSASHVVLTHELPDGHMGFPGALTARVTIRVLDGGVLDFVMEAETDAPTLCNLAHHSYFVLDDGRTISEHLLKVDTGQYLPVDGELIPTGEVRDVDGTSFDFRAFARLKQAHPVDHNFCLSQKRGAIRPVAWLKSQRSGVSMECRTTEPGLQIYDGANINIDLGGLSGEPMGAYAGLAMEPQVWPDANHHAHFPQAILRPDERYRQHTQFVFLKENT